MIHISGVLRPFSHVPGISLLIPGTHIEAEVFPTKVRFYDLSEKTRKKLKEVSLDVEGPVKEFTVVQDIERGCLTLFGKGLFYHILPTLELVTTRTPPLPRKKTETLSFGSHKKQEWEEIKKRGDFKEIFPLWHALGTRLALPPLESRKGMFSLLAECEEAIANNRPEHTLIPFQKLFLAGFRNLLVPRLEDAEYQGIIKEEGGEHSPLHLLTEGARLISSFFVRSEEGVLFLLPHLPPDFFAGRFVRVPTSFGEIDLEWTKKNVRQMVLRSTKSISLQLECPPSIKSFRFKRVKRERGKRLSCKERLELEAGAPLILDCFEK